MKVDLSKYKCFDYIIKSDTVLNLRSIPEPYVTKSSRNYSFYYDQVHFITANYLDDTYKADKSQIISYKYYTKREKEFLIDFPDNLYIEEGEFDIPYEYYSRAYIDFFDIEIFGDKTNLDLTARPITFELDPVGRLHIRKECLASYIYCMEKKLPTIKCEVVIGGYITSEEQYDLAEKYLKPHYIFPEKTSLFGIFTKTNSIAENYLKTIKKERLDFYLSNFVRYYDVVCGNARSLTGYIFLDGSFIFLDGCELYHYLFQKIVLDIDMENEEWEETCGIKLDTLHYVNNKVLALYNKDLITPEAKHMLYKLSKDYDIESQPYENRKGYDDSLIIDKRYKRNNRK